MPFGVSSDEGWCSSCSTAGERESRAVKMLIEALKVLDDRQCLHRLPQEVQKYWKEQRPYYLKEKK